VPDLGPWEASTAAGARLSFSENGAHDAVKRFQWSDSADPLHAATLPLQFRDQISVLISRLPNGQISLGASFFAGVYERAAVGAALADVLADPTRATTG
jgi:hypothetical protein